MTDQETTRRALEALDRAVYLLDRGLAPHQKVRAFRNAIAVVTELDPDELFRRAEQGQLTDLDGIGPSTGSVITDAVLERPSQYLDELDRSTRVTPGPGAGVRDTIRGDLHLHTTWSDGGASIEQMAHAAAALGHEYLAITDHSPRLTVAHGLNPDRLRAQLDEIDRLRASGLPVRLLTGMEVDILEDGSLDLPEDLLARLDIVVASVHSKLSMEPDEMTRRMAVAVASPHVDVLGHCTGRQLTGRGRPPSRFDADIVFAACQRFDTAVELNCRPERQDPPEDLLAVALEWGCHFTIDTDAHAPGQLEWQMSGCDKAVTAGVDPARILNTWPIEDLTSWLDRRN